MTGRLRVLHAVRSYMDEHGWAPSSRDLSRMTGLAVSNVHYHLEGLAHEGYIVRAPAISRGIRVTEKGRAA